MNEASPVERTGGGYVQESDDELMLRRFPGVDVIRTPSGGFYVRVLGAMAGDAEPLYVIDGSPVTVERGRGVQLRPEDIARIRVLRDPAETAVFGPRGVKGVILITTKLGVAARNRNR